MNAQAKAFVAAVQDKGSDAEDARDAAHEACHALQWGVVKAWTRDNIHAKKPRLIGDGVRAEIQARAVEQLVCRALKVRCGSVDKWAEVCFRETAYNEGIRLPSVAWIVMCVRKWMKDPVVIEMTKRVLALA